jgi:hypothetical protein
MRMAKTIFGSDGEKEAFHAIALALPSAWSVYPNLPLSQIVRVGKHELTATDWDLYLKTSVDFVLVDAMARPSLAIEFDGMGGGFSSSKTYIQKRPTRDPKREAKLQFKLHLCDKVDLPLMVISFEETRPCTDDTTLTVLSSIAAQHVATKTYKETIAKWDTEGRGAGKTWNEILWELADLDAKTQNEMDPFLRRRADQYKRFAAAHLRVSIKSLFDPNVLTHMRQKVPFESVGCRFTAKGGALPHAVTVVVWVRNWAGAELSGALSSDCPVKSGVNPLRIAQNIAECLGQEQALRMIDEKESPNKSVILGSLSLDAG